MNLQTTVEIIPPKQLINFESSLFLVGSCFTENIGNIFHQYKFSTFTNPCGITYNPISLANSIALTTTSKKLSDKDFVFYDTLWHSLHHHGKFSSIDKQLLISNIELNLEKAKIQLQKATHIFLTLGTAWIFKHIATQQAINNCHKIPNKEFSRHRMEVTEITNHLAKTIKNIRKINNKAEIILTVSPVRHLKDGLHDNQLSKASLLIAIDEIQKQYEEVLYFPAYELVIDELRDYRFFAENFTHLNSLGIQYLWNRLIESYISKESKKHFPTLLKVYKAISHKSSNTNKTIDIKFSQKTLAQIKELEKQFPSLDFSKEKKIIKQSHGGTRD